MTCWNAKRRGTDYVDGRLRASERERMAAHVAKCASCALEVEQMDTVRSALRNLPKPTAPAHLDTVLLIIASHERQSALKSRWTRLWREWKLRMERCLRPFSIPVTGGVLSSFVLFSALALTIGETTRAVTYEVPVMYADSIDPNLVPVELRSSVVLTLSLDESGRIRDYAVQDGSDTFVGDAGRLQYRNIALPEFRTVLAIRQPVNRDISIHFIPLVFRQ